MHAAPGGLRCLAVRLGLVYGPAPVMKTDYRFMTAPNKFCLQIVRGEELAVWGESRLGLIHVEDAVRALLLSSDPRLGAYSAVNAATDVTTVPEVARLVAEAAAERGLRATTRPPLVASPSLVASMPSRLDALGFQPRRRLQEGLGETLDYFLARRPRAGAPDEHS
jgi:nucleoside-diphosphate-sugar epimerase